jgi:predicted nucleotidyltransferase
MVSVAREARTMTSTRLSADLGRIAAFCRRHHVTRLSLFGSVLREDFGPGSDVDVLVEF